jgi:hypothetical protein
MKRKKKDINRNVAAAEGGAKGPKPKKEKGARTDRNPWEKGTAGGGQKAAAAGASRKTSGGRKLPPPVDKAELKQDYIFSMKHSPRLDENTPIHWIQFIPAVLFSAVVILLVKQYSYMRNMSVYFWSSEAAAPDRNNLTEFFSHYKTELIGWSLLLMAVMLAYRFTAQQLSIKRSKVYWPMLVYVLFVVLSFIFSQNRDIAWEGWNDRFEGTAMILCYYGAVFFIMNSVNSERNIKFIVYPIAAVSVILSIIGLSQATGHDFFQSTFGQKLLVPNEMNKNGDMAWDLIDQAAARGEKYLKFTFENNEIYQTVYNINYVSFYLTLLIPLFAMMFIWAKGLTRKVVWGVVLGLVIFNFFGAASSGGFVGIAVVVVFVVLVLRRKLLQWRGPVLIIVAIVAVVGIADIALVNHNGKGVKWTDELMGSIRASVATQPASGTQGVKGPGTPEGTQATEVSAGADGAEAAPPPAVTTPGPQSHLDYFSTEGNTLTFSVDGNKALMSVAENGSISLVDSANMPIAINQADGSLDITMDDARFANVVLQPTQDDAGNFIITLLMRGDEGRPWNFTLIGQDNSQLVFRNDLGKYVDLYDVPHTGFANNPGFGSGRGYIWSTSLPLIKDTILIGKGADTYCVNYPHNDYVGKYNAGWNINMIVDKPHNMYIATAINTGLISLIAMLALFGMYIVQSLKLYWRREFTTFAEYAGAGIFFGVSGFVASGLVDDSTVSVMPMFYALLATGIATNIMLKKRYSSGGAGTESSDSTYPAANQ